MFAKEKPSRHLITRSIIFKFTLRERGGGDVFSSFSREQKLLVSYFCVMPLNRFLAELNVNI